MKETKEALGFYANLNVDHRANLFIVSAILNGHPVRVLVDTGASISFIAAHFLPKLSIDLNQLSSAEDGMVVSLGDSSKSPVSRKLEGAEFVIGKHSSSTDFYLLSLPRGFDVVIGLDWMTKYDVQLSITA